MPSARANSALLVRVALAGTVFAALTIVAFRGGGYDRNVYLELGAAAWLGLAGIGLLRPRALGAIAAPRVRRLMLLLAALALLSALSTIWSDSAERSALEVLRSIGLLGVLALAVVIARRGGPEPILIGIAVATAVVAGAALGSRMLFDLFPANETAEFLPAFQNRLNHPLGYWNALAALLGMGLPLILHLVATSRSAVVRALASALAPAVGLALFLTLSRGGILAAICGLGLTFALTPSRSRFAIAVGAATVVSAALATAAAGQHDLFDGLTTPAAETQGIELLLLTVAAMIGAAMLMPWAMARGGPAIDSLAARLRWRPTRERRRRTIAVAGAATMLVALTMVATGTGSAIVDDFRSAELEGSVAGPKRLTSISSNTRFEYWGSAIDAGIENPVLGIGPGTWEFWWAEEGETGPFARDAHSLYLEAFAELGIPGLALILALVLVAVVGGVRVTRRERDPDLRSSYAALAGAALAFAVAASLDWAWEVTVLPMAFMLVAAPLAAAHGPRISGEGRRARIAALLIAGLVLVGLGSTLRSEWQISGSQSEASRGDLDDALESADSARRLRSYSASPLLPRALVEEALGRFDDAAVSARAAAEREPTNWRHQLIISRIEEASGDLESARSAFDRGRQLNPRSPVFAEANRP